MTTRPSHAALVEEVVNEVEKLEGCAVHTIATSVLSLIAARLSDVTPEMVEAYVLSHMRVHGLDTDTNIATSDWRAMLAASPLTPGDGKGEG